MGGQAFYLLNASDGSQRSSVMAFYSDEDSVNQQKVPDAYITIEGDGDTTWEGSLHSGTFPNTDVFQTCIISNAQSLGFGSLVGLARDSNRAWNIYKNDGRLAFQLNGVQYNAIYSCI